jgi:hypothetical protein
MTSGKPRQSWYIPIRGTYLLDAETKHVWLELCAEAAICEDPTRLGQLAEQIAGILGKEQQRISTRMFPGSPAVKKNAREQGAA